MAENNVIGVDFQINVDDLKNGLTEANKLIGLSNSKFKSASSGLDDWANSSEGLQAKLDNLNEVQSLQEKKLKAITKAYKKAAEEQGETSEAAKRLQKQMYDQQTVVNKTKKEYDKYSKKLTDVKNEEKKGQKASKDLGKAVKETGKEAKSSSEGFTVLKGAIAGFVVEAGKALVGGFSNMINESRDFRKEMSRVETAMLGAGFSSDQAKKSFTKLNAVLGDTGKSEEALQQLSGFATTEKELEDYTNILTGVYGKFGNSLPTEGLAEAINHTIQLGEVQGSLADALEWVGLSTDDFNEQLKACGSEQERNELISKTLNAQYGESAKTYKELNKSLIESQEAETENAIAMAKIGEVLEPLQTMFVRLKTKGIEAITPAIQKFSEILQKAFSGDLSGATSDLLEVFTNLKTKIVEKVLEIGEELPKQIPKILDKIMNFITGRLENQVELFPKILEILTNIITSIVEALPGLIQGLVNKLKELTPIILEAAKSMFNGLLEALPQVISSLLEALPQIVDTISAYLKEAIPQIVEAAIDMFNGLVEALPTVIQSLIDALPNVISSILGFIYDNLPVVLAAAIDLFMTLVKALPKVLGNLLGKLPSLVMAIASGFIKEAPQMFTASIQIFGELIRGLAETIANIITRLPTFIKGIIDAFMESVPSFKEIGKALIEGLWEGIKSTGEWLKEKIVGFGDSVVGWFKDTFKIFSPSHIMRDEIGEMLGLGVGEGLLNSSKDVLKDVNKFSKDLTKQFQSKVKGINAGLQGSIALNNNQGAFGSSGSGLNSNVNNFTQIINAPKQPSRIELYRQTKNLLALKGGY